MWKRAKLPRRKLTSEFESTGKLPPESPILEADGMKFFTDARNASVLAGSTASKTLFSHLNRLGPGDYFGLLAYIQMTHEHESCPANDAARRPRPKNTSQHVLVSAPASSTPLARPTKEPEHRCLPPSHLRR